MKTIENRKVIIANAQMTYRELIKAVCEKAPENGFTLAEMRERNRILDAIHKESDKYPLEDADYEKLKNLVLNMSWAVFDKEIIVFSEYIERLSEKEKSKK
jgi:hypothetical protein